MFRKSLFGGFREEDVLNYVREMHEKLASSEQQLKSGRKQAADYEKLLREMGVQVQARDEEFTRQAEQIKTLSADREDYARLKAVEEQMLRQKREYEDILRTADTIVQDAKNEAQNLVGNAAHKAAQLEQEIRRAYFELSAILESLNTRVEQFKARTERFLCEERSGGAAEQSTQNRPAADASVLGFAGTFGSALAADSVVSENPSAPEDAVIPAVNPAVPADSSSLENDPVSAAEPAAPQNSSVSAPSEAAQMLSPVSVITSGAKMSAEEPDEPEVIEPRHTQTETAGRILPIIRMPEPAQKADSATIPDEEQSAQDTADADSELRIFPIQTLSPENPAPAREEEPAPKHPEPAPATSKCDSFKALASIFADDAELMKIIENLRAFGAGQEAGA